MSHWRISNIKLGFLDSIVYSLLCFFVASSLNENRKKANENGKYSATDTTTTTKYVWGVFFWDDIGVQVNKKSSLALPQ